MRFAPVWKYLVALLIRYWIPDQVGNDNGGWGMDDGAGGLLTLPYRPFDSKGEETNPGILGCHDLIWGKG